jgi:predicted TPR repeat methyltransferase
MNKPKKRRRPLKIAFDISRRLGEAMRVHQGGDVPKALAMYEELLTVAPDEPTVLHFLGMGQIQLRQFAQGEANVKSALRIAPDYADAWNSLGNLYRLTGRPEEAMVAYQSVTRLAPAMVPGWVNLGDLYRQMGNRESAREALRRAVDLTENSSGQPPEVTRRLMVALATLDRIWGYPDESARLFGEALKLDPSDDDCRRQLIRSLVLAKRDDEALTLAREWKDREPDHPMPKRLYASLSGVDTPAQTPQDEIVKLFDGFAPSFDEQLSELGYRAPALLSDAVRRRLGKPRGDLAVCDAGCGTGLCGRWLRQYAARLTGVDLSQGMLDLARDRQLYDSLERSDLTAWLRERAVAFGLIVSADVLCYFGELLTVAQASFGALGTSGMLAFTVEHATEPRPEGYRLLINGRYAHNESYVHDCLALAGFTAIEIDQADLRMEGRVPVAGLVVTARRDAV